jgi:hypothetical protein
VRIDDLGFEAPPDRCGDERVVRRAASMGDDGELHTEIVQLSPGGVGRDAVTRWCRTRYRADAPFDDAFGTGSSR